MYKNASKFNSSRIASVVFLVLGIPSALISLIGMLGSLGQGYIPDYIILPIVMFIASVIMIIAAIATLRIVGAASYVAWTLERDSDGIVPMDTILGKKGKSKGSSYERLILKAHAKGYFTKVAYNSTERVFELSDRIEEAGDYEKHFIGINCPNCGAPLKIREGSSLVCPTCGSEVKA